jgi:hypothetical protein
VKGKKVKGYMKGGDINDSLPGIEGLDAKFGQSVADGNKATGDAIAKRIQKAKDLEAKSMEGRDLTAKEKKARKRAADNKKLDAKAKEMLGPEKKKKKNNTTKSSPLDAPKPPMAGAPKPPMGGMGGAPKPPMGGMGGGMPPKKPPMPMMNKGGKVKKGGSCGGYKKGGKVRGAGIARQGVKKCKMR